jgi:hypothetical protein
VGTRGICLVSTHPIRPGLGLPTDKNPPWPEAIRQIRQATSDTDMSGDGSGAMWTSRSKSFRFRTKSILRTDRRTGQSIDRSSSRISGAGRPSVFALARVSSTCRASSSRRFVSLLISCPSQRWVLKYPANGVTADMKWDPEKLTWH